VQFFVDGPVCSNLKTALPLEWLETNGLGGFASSTVAGINTRRYHGLLTAALQPPVERYLLLAKLEETLEVNGQRFDLSANLYPGAAYPSGHRHLSGFRLDPFPIFTYRAGGVEIEKRVFMVDGENTTVVEYEVRGGNDASAPQCHLEIRPLIAFRDYHSLTHANDALNPAVRTEPGIASVEPYPGLPRLYLTHSAGSIAEVGEWYRNFEYPAEAERGLDHREDLFCPLALHFELSGAQATVIASITSGHCAAEAPALREAEIARRRAITGQHPAPQPALVAVLTSAASQFVVQRGALRTVIAGYHWFGDWGRDTMISLAGLTLVTGRYGVARDILEAFAGSIDRGMLPNRFPDAGEAPEYNTVDATLWFFEAIRAYAEYSGDTAFVRDHLYTKLKEIIDWHLRGTRYGIHVDLDGLVAAGQPGVQLTWMDAKVGGRVATPRHGKPVEIQALWYNALRVMEEFARSFDNRASEALFANMATRARTAFNRAFWNEAGGCLYDVVNGDLRDESIRPNQIFALSLPHSMMEPERARGVLKVVERDLLTPFGLRTLARSDPAYRGRYLGSPAERDAAYHQGTVWPWLLGPFVSAYLRWHGGSAEAARHRVAGWLAAFEGHLQAGCLGSVSEILDGDAPHMPRGAVAQAWSVAELLRAAASTY
jgi:predicted glycogen debranching enzyme